MKTALEIDPGFQTFHKLYVDRSDISNILTLGSCLEHNIPFNVISAGLRPILRRVLDQFLGEEEASHIQIVANDAQINTPGTEWKPVWIHDNELGHDKELSVKEARAQALLQCEDGTVPLIVFIGDGVSDLPAARQADVLFARKGLRLEEYCIENKIPYLPFDTFLDIKSEIEAIMKEDEKATKGLGMPQRVNPRANIVSPFNISRNFELIYTVASYFKHKEHSENCRCNTSRRKDASVAGDFHRKSPCRCCILIPTTGICFWFSYRVYLELRKSSKIDLDKSV
jgi:2-hydroxy-3-keto-5-methylthiopentenyl-1-phosphate phosphatase